MAMKQVQFSTTIHATKEIVWKTLWSDKTFGEWASIIDPGTYMVGELKEGNEVQFISAENGYGVTSLVDACVPYNYVLLKHRADTQDTGKRNRDDQWTGGQESYTLVENNEKTTLTVAFSVPPELKDYFDVTYPKALQKLKTLAEQY